MRELVATGNSLVAKAAIECGCRFFGGYPITPSSEIAHELSRLLPLNDGSFIQMEDEISGISVSIGAAMSGAKAMTASSGPGISLKSEQIGYAFIAEIPLVIANVMRGGPSTGLPTRVAQGDLWQTGGRHSADRCLRKQTLCARRFSRIASKRMQTDSRILYGRSIWPGITMSMTSRPEACSSCRITASVKERM